MERVKESITGCHSEVPYKDLHDWHPISHTENQLYF